MSRVARRRLRRLSFEPLESRRLLATDLEVTNLLLVDQSNNPITAPVHGERVYLRAMWTATDLEFSDNYRVRFFVDDVALDSATITGGPGENLSKFWRRSGWYASPGQHTVRVIIDGDNDVAEVDELNNEFQFTFTTAAPDTLPNKLIWPLEGEAFVDIGITNYVDVDPTEGVQDFQGRNASYDGHSALDAGPGNFQRMDAGVKIFAAANGVVVDAHDGEFDRHVQFSSSPANYVILDHGNGWRTVYWHMRRDSLQVDIGETVSAGDFLGYVGSSGRSTAAHIHFGLQHHGRPVEPFYDPASYWVAPPRYVFDEPAVYMSGVTNYNPSSHNKERASDFTTFQQKSGQQPKVWARFSGLKENDLVEYRWLRPSGAPFATGSFNASRDYSNAWFWYHFTLPGIPDLGTWTVEFRVNGVKLGEETFDVVVTGVPEIRVEETAGGILLDERFTPIDFGDVAEGGSAPTHEFHVVNHGEAPLLISSVVVPEGFSVVEGLAGSIAPGATDSLTIAMNTTASGYRAGQVHIYSNDKDEAEYSISVEGVVNSPATSELTLGLGERRIGEGNVLYGNVERQGSTAEPLTVALAGSNAQQLDAPSTVTIPAGRRRVRFLIAAVDNQIVELDEAVRLTATAAGYASATNELIVVDDDEAGFTITESEGATIATEGGPADTFDVVLDAQPLADVTVTMESADAGVALVSPITITFTPADWNTPRTVTVLATNDLIVDGDQTTIVTVSAAAESKLVTVIAADDDVPGITVSQSGDQTSVTEAGSTDFFTVALSRAPTSDVVFKVNSDDTGEATVLPATLTFTPTNWSAAQSVSVQGVDDFVVDGSQMTDIIISVDDVISNDAFDSLADHVVEVTTTDDDDPGITIVESGGATLVAESGLQDSFSVALAAAPINDVVLNLQSDALDELTVSPATLTFTSANWNVSQSVAVSAVNDLFVDGTTSTAVAVVVNASSDEAYRSLGDTLVNVSTLDNDVAGFAVTETDGSAVVESGPPDSFTVVLTRGPTSNVVLTIESDDPQEVTIGVPTVTFTAANWDVPQTVNFTGAPDFVNDGPQVTEVTISVDDLNSNNAFDNLADQIVQVTTQDIDVNQPPILGTIGSQLVDEAQLLTFNVTATDAESPDNLNFRIDGGAPAGAGIHPSTGVFTWTPSESQGPGTYEVTVRVTDNGYPNLSDADTFMVTVAETNTPPVLAPIGNQSIPEDGELAFTAIANDSDLPANGLSFSLDAGAPAGAAIHPTTGEFTWQPSVGPGNYDVNIRVTDDGSPPMSDFETVRITVTSGNPPPEILNEIGDVQTQAFDQFHWTILPPFSDPEAQPIAIRVESANGQPIPDWLAFDPATLTFQGMPRESDVGDLELRIIGTDEGMPPQSSFQDVTLTVTDNPFPWHNHDFPADVDDSGYVSTTDLRIAFVWLSAVGADLPAPGPSVPPSYLDVSPNGVMTVTDLRLIFTFILSGAESGGEGEADEHIRPSAASTLPPDIVLMPMVNDEKLSDGLLLVRPCSPKPKWSFHSFDDDWEALLDLLAEDQFSLDR